MVVIFRTAWFIRGKKLNKQIICTLVRHEYCLVQMHLKSQLHFGKTETTFGTRKLHALYQVNANYVRYIRCTQNTCAKFSTRKLHALYSVHVKNMSYIRCLQTTCAAFGRCKLHALPSVHANYMRYVRYTQTT